MVTDVEAFDEHAGRSNSLDVQFIFVQAERSPNSDSSKIGQFQYGVEDYFKKSPTLPRSKKIIEAAAIKSAIYAKSSRFKKGNPICRLFYVTTGEWTSDPLLEARRKSTISDLQSLGIFREVHFSCIGRTGIQNLYNRTKNAISREFLFENRTVIPEIHGVTEAYLGFVPASIFLSIIADDDGEIIKSLFYDNVRDWENYNAVNVEIRETLETDSKSLFVLMNNGVTIIAQTIRPTANKFFIEDFQIVNGCQTSHVLADQQKYVDDTVMIPLRLIGTQDENVIAAIIKATNRQTEIKKEQFFALTDFAKKLELYFQALPEGRKLYYERRYHQYDASTNEKTRIVTPANLI